METLRLLAKYFLAALLTLVLLPASLTQQSRPKAVPEQPPAIPPAQCQPAPKIQTETHISAAEAQELFRSVDSILKFASEDTRLAIHQRVKRELASREQVQSYIQERIKNDEDAQRLQRSELVLKKFGLLPPEFNLRAFLVQLLREQVAGYYNPKNKTVYMLDWVEPEAQRPVLAHELTHALQDQNFQLEKWANLGRDPRSDQKKTGQDSDQDPESDEQIAAREAVVEGQAMAVLIDYLLAPSGRSLADSPMIADAIKMGMMQGSASPILESAPLYIREALMFPYRYGLGFVREVLVKSGKEQAFAGIFRKPPQNTRQVMEPATYLQGERLEPLRIPNLPAILGPSYQRYDQGAVGEFDISVILRQYATPQISQRLTPAWRGGYYYTGHKANGATGNLALVYISKWASKEAAAEFADAYASALGKRYKILPDSKMLDQDSGAARWRTEQGAILIEASGDLVLVVENFEDTDARKIREAVFASSRAGLATPKARSATETSISLPAGLH